MGDCVRQTNAVRLLISINYSSFLNFPSSPSDRDMSSVHETNDRLMERGEFSGQDFQLASSKHWLWFWVALLGASLPMLIPYLVEMWSYEHYRYIPFVFLVVGYLVWTRSDRVIRPPAGWLGWTMVICGVIAILIAVLAPSTWFAGVGFVILSAAFVGSMRGPDDPSLLGSAVPLLMLMQIPLGQDQKLINRLQQVTTDLSSVALDVLGVPHSVEGNTMQLVSRELFVAEACSGIQSVFTLAFIACVIVAINRRRLWLTPIYLLISVLLAIAGNTLRVSAVAVAEHWFAVDLSEGWQHDVLGYVTLGIATLFLLSFDQLIVTLLHPANVGGSSSMDSPLIRLWNYLVADWHFSNDDGVYGGSSASRSKKKTRAGWLDKLLSNRIGWMTAIGVFAVLGLGAAVQATRVEINQAPKQLLGSYVVFNPKPELLQGTYQITTVGQHQVNRDGKQPRLGQNADLWDVQIDQRLPGQIVVSQTYRGWHDLCTCYQNMDWEELSREVTEPEGTDGASFVTARYKNRQGDYGYLLFSAVNEDGTIPDAPEGSLGSLFSRLNTRLEMEGVISMGNLVMFQMWLVTAEKISPETLKKMQADFVEMRSRLSVSVVNDAVNKSTTTGQRSNGEG